MNFVLGEISFYGSKFKIKTKKKNIFFGVGWGGGVSGGGGEGGGWS